MLKEIYLFMFEEMKYIPEMCWDSKMSPKVLQNAPLNVYFKAHQFFVQYPELDSWKYYSGE